MNTNALAISYICLELQSNFHLIKQQLNLVVLTHVIRANYLKTTTSIFATTILCTSTICPLIAHLWHYSHNLYTTMKYFYTKNILLIHVSFHSLEFVYQQIRVV